MSGSGGQVPRASRPEQDGIGSGVDDPALQAMAAELARYAADASPAVPDGLAARVQVAISSEPVYSPVRRFAHALPPAGWPALPGAVRGVLRAALGFGGPIPVAVRVESAALVVVMLVVVGAGTVAGTGGLRALASVLSAPAATPSAPAAVGPSPWASPSPGEPAESSAEPAASTEPSPTPSPSPSVTPRPAGAASARPPVTPSPRPEPSPEATETPGGTPEPSEASSPGAPGSTPEPSDSGEPSGGGSPGSGTPHP